MILQTPVGVLEVAEDMSGITAIRFLEEEPLTEKTTSSKEEPFCQLLAKQMEEYFSGKRNTFSVPISLQTGTPFQRAVWQALQEIPYGETRTYQEISQAIDRPKAVRAVGQANRKNPLPIVIPCHRVIGKNGHLTGYLGAAQRGMAIKEHLLQLETSKRSTPALSF